MELITNWFITITYTKLNHQGHRRFEDKKEGAIQIDICNLYGYLKLGIIGSYR